MQGAHRGGTVLDVTDGDGRPAAALEEFVDLPHQPLLLHNVQPLPQDVLVDALHQLYLQGV